MKYLEDVKPFVGTTLVWAIPLVELADLGINAGNPPDSFTYKVTGVDVANPSPEMSGDFDYNNTTLAWEARFNGPLVPGIYAMWAHATKGSSDGKWSSHFQVLAFSGN